MEKRLIEDSLPLKEISEQSAREKSIRHGHISTLHLWWARRPLAACRAAVYASLVPAPGDEEERKEQHEFIKKLVNWDTLEPSHKDHWVIEEAKKRILEANGGVPPKVLDPFAGGGSIPLEAQRLGCETYASDLNPVAHIIQLCTLYYPQKFAHLRLKNKDEFGQEYDGGSQLVHDVRKWGEWVYERVKEEIGHLYDTGNPDETPVAYIWARTVTCPNPACRSEMPLVKQWWLFHEKYKKVSIKPKPNLLNKCVDFDIVEDDKINFNPSEGTVIGGNAVCLCCGQVLPVDDIRQLFRDNKQGERLLAVIFYNTKINGKNYRLANRKDKEIFNEAIKKYNDLKNEQIGDFSAIPDELLPPVGTLGIRVNNYGYKKWGSLFNPREIVALTTFCKYIRQAYKEIQKQVNNEEYSKAVITYLACSLSNLSRKLNTLAVWNGTIQNAFGRQAIAMMWEYPEGNSLSESAGSWRTYLDSLSNGLEGINFNNYSKGIVKGSASKLNVTDSYYNAIISDPPYYDAVPYSHLSDFFYVWLKRCINFLYPEIFVTELTPKRSEIIQDTFNKKTKDVFEQKMEEIFLEFDRVLRKNGLIILIYAHKTTEAWETLITGLLHKDLIVTASWPLHTERPARLRAQKSAALASSVFIVCRKRTIKEEGFLDDVEKELKEVLYERLNYFWSQGIRGADFFMSAIGPAVQVFGRYKKVQTYEGKELTVGDLLTKVRAIVSDFAIERIVKSKGSQEIDDESRFYLLWRWAYGSSSMPAGEVIPMAQSLGVEFNELVSKSGLLQKKGQDVSLKSPFDRKKEKNMGEPDNGKSSPLIDILHRAVNLWQEGDRQELSNFISRACHNGSDTMEQLAQSIIDVLPDNDKEATLYVNFLTGMRQLPAAKEESKYIQEEF